MTLFVPAIHLSGEINDMPVSREQIDYMISIIGGRVFETLMQGLPVKDRKQIDLKKNLLARWVAQRDLNAITKEYYQILDHFLKEGISEDRVLNCAAVQTVLLQRPQDRVTEWQGRLLVMKIKQGLGVDIASLMELKKRDAKYDYHYAENPDIFFTHHRLPLLNYVDQLLSNETDFSKIEIMIANLQVISPSLFILNSDHICPIIASLKNEYDVGECNTLQNALIRLNEDDVIFIKTWIEKNKIEGEFPNKYVKSISLLVDSYELTQKIKLQITTVHDKLKLEMMYRDLIKQSSDQYKPSISGMFKKLTHSSVARTCERNQEPSMSRG